jgi:hypothetical protein
VERLAVAVFTNEIPSRKLITKDAFRKFFQIDASERLPKTPFYLELNPDKKPHIGVIYIDLGGHPRGIALRATRKISGYLDQHWFDAEIKAKRFSVTVLTGRKSKVPSLKKALIAAIDYNLEWGARTLLKKKELSEHLQVEVVHLPEIEGLLPGRNDYQRPPKI